MVRSSSSVNSHDQPQRGVGARLLAIVPRATTTTTTAGTATAMGNQPSAVPEPPPSPSKTAGRLRKVFFNAGKGKQRAVTAPVAPPHAPVVSHFNLPAQPSPLASQPPTPPPKDEPTQPRTLEQEKEHWRTSVASAHTVRPRSGVQTRPVSMAESTSTVMAHKRRSALVAEAEFVMDDSERAKSRKRHSISLHFAAPASPAVATPPATTATTSAAAEGYIGAAQRAGSASSAGSQIRGRLAAWTTSPSPSLPSEPASPLPPPPTPPAAPTSEEYTGWVPQKLTREPTLVRPEPTAPSGLGMFGFGKRVVRALGMQSASESGHPPPSRSPTPERRARRTPNAPSGTWSVHTDASSAASTQSHALGPRVRAPQAASGQVFGRPLRDAVRDTALEHVRAKMDADGGDMEVFGPDAPLADRALPALVVRCVQHIVTWGLEEEGLFRISGRASHIARLRAEFDTGADFDLQASPPGELDPHAVASVFKAYLRELPEPILTKQLTPVFEAAMDAENEARRSIDTSASQSSPKPAAPHPMPRRPTLEGGLPSSPRPTARTARSPSTASSTAPPHSPPVPSLAHPALQIAPPSAHLLRTFRALVARLPRAHADLLRTVAHLIRATAARKETRMPLSNLTVVFCPSLGLSPSILRVLCEQDEIWVPLSEAELGEMRAEKAAREAAAARAAADGDAPAPADEPAPETPVPETPVPQTPAEARALYGAPSPLLVSRDDASSLASAAALSSASSSSLATPAASTDDLGAPSRSFIAGTSQQRRARAPGGGLHAFPSAPNLGLRALGVHGLSQRSLSSKSSRARVAISGPLELREPGSADSSPSPLSSRAPSRVGEAAPADAGEEERDYTRPIPRAKRPSLTALFSKASLSSLRSSRILTLGSPRSPRGSGSPRDTLVGGGARETLYGAVVGGGSGSNRETFYSTRDTLYAGNGNGSGSGGGESARASVVDDAPPHLELGLESSPLRVPGVLTPPASDLPPEPASAPASARDASPPGSARAVPAGPRPSPPRRSTNTPPSPASAPAKEGLSPVELAAPYNRLSLWEDEGQGEDGLGGIDGAWASSVLLAADAGWRA